MEGGGVAALVELFGCERFREERDSSRDDEAEKACPESPLLCTCSSKVCVVPRRPNKLVRLALLLILGMRKDGDSSSNRGVEGDVGNSAFRIEIAGLDAFSIRVGMLVRRLESLCTGELCDDPGMADSRGGSTSVSNIRGD